MRSKANFKTHPLHPMLNPFPIAFFTGSLFFDVAGAISAKTIFYEVSQWLQVGGVGFALIAALPGFIDYLYTVPPKSTGKKRAAQHGLLNVLVVIIFLGVWFYRQQANYSVPIIIVFELIGVVLLTYAGWMGGTLVFRNQIGVDHRYAFAGKWKEETVEIAEEHAEVARTDELKLNQMKLLHIDGRRIVIGRTENGYVAFDDFCTHRGGSLAGGSMVCSTVICPWHGSQFDVSTGKVKAGPAEKSIKIYTLIEKDGKILLDITG